MSKKLFSPRQKARRKNALSEVFANRSASNGDSVAKRCHVAKTKCKHRGKIVPPSDSAYLYNIRCGRAADAVGK